MMKNVQLVENLIYFDNYSIILHVIMKHLVVVSSPFLLKCQNTMQPILKSKIIVHPKIFHPYITQNIYFCYLAGFCLSFLGEVSLSIK